MPDVSGEADPETGVLIISVTGEPESAPIGGTSLTAPLWAALIARLNQTLGVPVGFLNPILYKYMAQGVLRDIAVGDNGTYSTAVGYDAVTGLGSPDGSRLVAALQVLGATPPHALAPVAASHPRSVDVRLAEIERTLASIVQQEAATRSLLSALMHGGAGPM